MLTIVDGNPGSGKTYYAVEKISRLSPEKQNKIVHNIDGCLLGKSFYQVEQEQSIPLLTLFSAKFHEINKEFHGYYFILDEASSVFGDKFANQDVFEFFQKHRHYGIDIILITPEIKLITFKITSLAELHLRAVSDTSNPLPGTFLYKKTVGQESIGNIFIRKKKAVYYLYKTANFNQDETRKKSRPMLLLLIGAVLMVVVALVASKYFIGSFKEEKPIPEKVTKTQTEISNVSEKKNKAPNNKNNNVPSSPDNQNASYPQSIIEKIGGVIMPLDIVTLNQTVFVVFGDVLLNIQFWPYQAVKTEFGYISIVPEDVYQSFHESKKRSASSSDPNQKYLSQNETPQKNPTSGFSSVVPSIGVAP